MNKILLCFALGVCLANAQDPAVFQTLPSGYVPYAINNSNQIAGSFGSDGFVLNFGGPATQFRYPGSISTVARGINSAGDVTGWYRTTAAHCFVRTVSGTFSTFDVPGAANTYCYGINDTGTLVGAYEAPAGVSHGFVKEGASVRTIDYPLATQTVATAINNAGAIAGYYNGGQYPYTGIVWDPSGTITSFSILETTRPFAINNNGQIAVDVFSEYAAPAVSGYIREPDGTTRLYGPGGNLYGLNDSGVAVGLYNPDRPSPYVTIGCPMTIGPYSTTLTGAQQQTTVSVTTGSPSSCLFNIRSNASWIRVISPLFYTYNPGPGVTSVVLSVDPNPGVSVRTGTVSIGNQTFTIQQTGTDVCPPTLAATAMTLPNELVGRVRVQASSTCAWTATSDADWLTIIAGASGTGNGDIVFRAAPSSNSRTTNIRVGAQTLAVAQNANSCLETLPYVELDPVGSTGTFDIPERPACPGWTISGMPSWLTILSGTSGTGAATVRFSAQPNAGPSLRFASLQITRSNGLSASLSIRQEAPGQLTGSRFIPVAPCRLFDTRTTTRIQGGTVRDFAIPSGPCNIPTTATAYSLNVTAIPVQALAFLTLWPTGAVPPNTSTLNSYTGAVVANAAIVAAGTNKSVSVFASNPTDVVLDINGYFVDANTAQSLAFYAVAPCRIVDTRQQPGSGFSGTANTRTFPMTGRCQLPANARAYSTNVTLVPNGAIPFLTVWPAGQSQPFTSTLNSAEGRVVSNAAIVPAGDHGDLSVYAFTAPGATADVILDVNGYFAPPDTANPLSFHTIDQQSTLPCRLGDTRSDFEQLALRSPAFPGGTSNRVTDAKPGCALKPGGASVLNITVVPQGSLQYLTLSPYGSVPPLVSTLNSFDGRIVANMAILGLAEGNLGSSMNILTVGSKATDVVVDVIGQFSKYPPSF